MAKRSPRFLLVLCSLGAAALWIAPQFAAEEDLGFPVFFEDSRVVLRAVSLNGTTYLPVIDLVQHLKLPFTDALSLETLTVRSGDSRLVLSRNSSAISVNNQIASLRHPVVRENGRWLVPIEFLNVGLARLTGRDFRVKAGAKRAFVRGVAADELAMAAQSLGASSRLTIRTGSGINMRLDRQEGRAIVQLGDGPFDPERERLDYSDRFIRSVTFDDSDGKPKLIVEVTPEANDIRISALDAERIHFIDFAKPETASTAPASAPAPEVATPAKSDPTSTRTHTPIRTIVLDPGHGGADSGSRGENVVEKDITLEVARRLRTELQRQLGATVLLTRDADVELGNEARAMVANNNHAHLFISIHAGYAPGVSATESTIFLMRDGFTTNGAGRPGSNRLFVPWYFSYRQSIGASRATAEAIREELHKTLSGWNFSIQYAPLSVLTSPRMPAMVVELGNLSDPEAATVFADGTFHSKFAQSIVNAISQPPGDR